MIPAAAAIVVLQAIVVVAAAVLHRHDVLGDDDGGEEPPVCGGGSGERRAFPVDNISRLPTVLYSNAARLDAQLGRNFFAAAGDPLAAAFGWRRRRAAGFRFVERLLHPVLHVVGQPGGQRARVQLVELD